MCLARLPRRRPTHIGRTMVPSPAVSVGCWVTSTSAERVGVNDRGPSWLEPKRSRSGSHFRLFRTALRSGGDVTLRASSVHLRARVKRDYTGNASSEGRFLTAASEPSAARVAVVFRRPHGWKPAVPKISVWISDLEAPGATGRVRSYPAFEGGLDRRQLVEDVRWRLTVKTTTLFTSAERTSAR